MGSTLGAWFIGNTLSQNMLNTGAFEVYYDGETIFSKIESHRLPSMPELMNDLTIAIERYQQKALGDTSEPAPARRAARVGHTQWSRYILFPHLAALNATRPSRHDAPGTRDGDTLNSRRRSIQCD